MLKILKRLRNYLISGLLFWIPLILTIVVIKFFLEFINSLVPQEYLPEAIFNLDTTIPGSGIILLFIIILIHRGIGYEYIRTKVSCLMGKAS